MWLRVWGFSPCLDWNFEKKTKRMLISQKSMGVFQIENPTKIFELPGTVSLFLYCPSGLSPSEGEEKG